MFNSNNAWHPELRLKLTLTQLCPTLFTSELEIFVANDKMEANNLSHPQHGHIIASNEKVIRGYICFRISLLHITLHHYIFILVFFINRIGSVNVKKH